VLALLKFGEIRPVTCDQAANMSLRAFSAGSTALPGAK